MKIRDLLKVLDTDSIYIYCDGEIEVEAELPYIEMACNEYMDRKIERITPLNNSMEIIIK
jgi:hypothetical protein